VPALFLSISHDVAKRRDPCPEDRALTEAIHSPPSRSPHLSAHKTKQLAPLWLAMHPFLFPDRGCITYIALHMVLESARGTDRHSYGSVIDTLRACTNPHLSSSLDPRATSGKVARELLTASGAESDPGESHPWPVAAPTLDFPPRELLSSRARPCTAPVVITREERRCWRHRRSHHIIPCVIGPAPGRVRSRDESRNGLSPGSSEPLGAGPREGPSHPEAARGAIHRICGLMWTVLKARGTYRGGGYLGAFRGTAPAPGRPFRLDGCLPDSAMATSSSRGEDVCPSLPRSRP
jgi:hypothetical protein